MAADAMLGKAQKSLGLNQAPLKEPRENFPPQGHIK